MPGTPSAGNARIRARMLQVSPGGIALACFAVAGVLCLVHVINGIAVGAAAFSFDHEGSFTTLGAAAFFALGGVLALTAARRDHRYRNGWIVVGLVGLLFAVEEGGLMLHERFEQATSTGVGLLMAVAFAGFLLLVALREGSLRLPSPAATAIVLAAFLLVLSQVLGGIATRAEEGIIRDVFAAGEECGEVAVAAMAVLAAGYFLVRSGRSLSLPSSA